MSSGYHIATTNETNTFETNLRPILAFLFAQGNGDNRPHLILDIFGVKLRGLLDSGATRTVLGGEGWKAIQHLGLKLQPADTGSCRVANDQSCKVLGSIELPMRLENKIKVISVLVVPDISSTLVLGMDFWLSMQIIPDLSSGCWNFSQSPSENFKVNSLMASDLLSSEQLSRLNKVIDAYFVTVCSETLGCTPLVEHKIVTSSEPIKQRAYRVSPAMQEHMDCEIQKMLRNDVIEPSSSAWSSPVVLVPKKDGSYRFCVDYRKLNSVTKKDAYPIPFISTILDKLGHAKYLSSMDIKSAYWQVAVEKESREYTAFAIPGRGIYQFKRMPFGLTNSPCTFQRLMDRLLGPELEPNVFVYLDDIIVVTETFEKHLEVLQEIFSRLKKANLTLAREKCKFCRPELKYLGYVVNAKGVHVDPEKVQAILDIPSPRNVTEVRRILGVASWYRRFIPSFSTLVAPMTRLLRKSQKFCWTEECEKSLRGIKNTLISAPILSCPNFSEPFILQTDASAYGLGAVLSQIIDREERVICYISRSLSKPERNYTVTERECLSVIWAVHKLRAYLEGYHFTVITDHHSLIWLHNLKEPTGRLARWTLRLQEFDFKIVHRRGKEHVVPDLLSRAIPDKEAVVNEVANQVEGKDKWYQRMIENVRQNPLRFPQWRIENNVLFKSIKSALPYLGDDVDNWKTVVPKHQRIHVIKENHDLPTAGHCGVYKTYERLKQRYYWPKMRSDITKYIKHCPACLAHKPEQAQPPGLMGNRIQPSRPWQIIAADLCGPLPRTARGNKFILVVTDCFSKFSLLFPLRTATASAVSKAIEENIYLLFGTPQYLICDNGVQFRSRQFTHLCSEYKVKLSYTPVYHPQANPVERVNREVKRMLASYVTDNHKLWDTLLPKVGCALRTNKHEVTLQTPYFINFGREHVLLGETHEKQPFGDGGGELIARSGLTERQFNQLFEDIKRRLVQAHEKAKTRYDLRHRPVQYEVGARVLRKNYALSNAINDFAAKLAPRYVGPYLIKRKLSAVTYELASCERPDKSIGVWHVKDLKAHPPDMA